jgi:hypothetical protein
MMIKPLKTKPLEIGDLIYLTHDIIEQKKYDIPKIGVVVRVKKLLRLYDILLQKEKTYLKDVNEIYISKI